MPKPSDIIDVYSFIGCRSTEGAIEIALKSQQAVNAFSDTHNKFLYRILGIALKLRPAFEDRSTWKQLCNHPYWKGRSERYRPLMEANTKARTINLALFLFAGPAFANADRASKYGRVLHYAFLTRIPAESFAELAEREGGVEALLKKAKEHDAPSKAESENAVKEKAKGAARDEIVNDDDLFEDQDDQVENEDEEIETETDDGDLTINLKPVRSGHDSGFPGDLQRKIRDKRLICIESTVEQTLESLNIAVGERVVIEAVLANSPGKWKRLVAKKVRPK